MSKDIVKLSIPNKPDYISVVRLTSSSICSNMGFNIEDIEDVKVAISEACINALNMIGNLYKELNIVFEIEKDKLVINMENVSSPKILDKEFSEESQLGLLIIESLMDKVEFSHTGVKMIKYIEDGTQ